MTELSQMARTARFEPRRADTLREVAKPYVGRTFLWRAMWVITEEDGGPYVGQTAWQPDNYADWFGWVPDEDLVDVTNPNEMRP